MIEANIDKWKTAIEGVALGMNIYNQDFGTMLSSLGTAMGFVKPAYQLFAYLSNPRIMFLHYLKKDCYMLFIYAILELQYYDAFCLVLP